MRIAMLLHKSVEHDSRVRREARALAEAGHEVTVLHLPRVRGELDGELDGFEVRSVTPRAWVRRLLPFGLYRMVFFAAFMSALRRLRPDAVHAHDVAMLAPGLAGARLAHARLVYDSHEYAAGVPYRERSWARFVTTLERFAIRHCAAVITVSDGIADRLRQAYGLHERPTVVRNIPDPRAYSSAFRAPDLRAGLGAPRDAPLILHLGAAAPDRGCETLVRALQQVPDAHLLFLGADDRGYVERLELVVDEAEVSDRVHFRPSVPIAHVPAYVSQANLGISLLEDTCENHRLALPNKVFEYVAAGIPVVTSDLPELRRLVDQHRIGRTADSADPSSVASALRTALKEGRSSVLAGDTAEGGPFGWDQEAARLRAVYAALETRATAHRALVLVRNTCTHDARVLREAKTLVGAGHDVHVLGVVSSVDHERSTDVDGVRIERLAPVSPASWVRRAQGRRSVRSGDAGVSGASKSRGASAPSARAAAHRVNRWLVTLDYNRLGVLAVRRIRPRLVHCNDYNTMWIGVAAKLSGSRVVYDCHELWPDRNLRPESRWWLLACEALFVRLADTTITTSPGYARAISDRYRVPVPRLVRNVPDWRVAGNDADVRSTSPLAVYFGAITRGRGLDTALHALALVPELRMRLVGPEAWEYRNELEALADRLGVRGRLELLAPVPPDAAASVLTDAHIGLALIEPACRSYELTLPNKLFEYVAAGLPVLASEVPVLAGQVTEHGIGLTADARDPTMVAAGIRAMLTEEAQLAFRAKAVELARSWHWDYEIAQLQDAYRAAMEGAA